MRLLPHSIAGANEHKIRACGSATESLPARDLFVRESYTLRARAPQVRLHKLQLGVKHDPLTKEIPRDTDSAPEQEAVAKVEAVEHQCVTKFQPEAVTQRRSGSPMRRN